MLNTLVKICLLFALSITSTLYAQNNDSSDGKSDSKEESPHRKGEKHGEGNRGFLTDGETHLIDNDRGNSGTEFGGFNEPGYDSGPWPNEFFAALKENEKEKEKLPEEGGKERLNPDDQFRPYNGEGAAPHGGGEYETPVYGGEIGAGSEGPYLIREKFIQFVKQGPNRIKELTTQQLKGLFCEFKMSYQGGF